MAIIGIDLGTTNSLVSVYRNGKVELIPNQFGEYLTPSVVSFNDDGSIVVGKIARERLISHPGQTFSSYKQYMGSKEKFVFKGHKYQSEDLSSFVLKQLKEDAEKYLGEEVEEAIISVPAYFNDLQRVATRNAGLLAGLKVDRILNEPSAAALAYREKKGDDGLFVVFDFGGGTLDISLVEIFANIVDIIAVAGDNHLGGDDIDELLMKEFCKENKITISGEKEKAILKRRIEQAKKELSYKEEVEIELLLNNEIYKQELNQQKLALTCVDILEKIRSTLERVLRDGQKHISEIERIICVGGSTKSKMIQDYLYYLTDINPEDAISPDEAVAYGIAVAAGIKERNEDIKDMILTDICPFTLGTGIIGDEYSPIISRNTSLPTSRSRNYVTVRDNQPVISFAIYQGEAMKASKNLLLDTMEVSVPLKPAGKAMATVTYTYDLNGILDVDIVSLDTGDKVSKLIVTNEKLSAEEIEARRKELEKVKINVNSNIEFEYLMATAERIYEELPPYSKDNFLAQVSELKHMYYGTNYTDQYRAVQLFQELLGHYGSVDTGLKKNYYN